MALDRFLDTNGLRLLWEKIKSLVQQNTHEYSVEELETPTSGYRNSYRLEKDGAAITGSDTIDIPTELTPIVSKEYLDDTFYASTTSVENSSRYFMTVTPDAANTFWYVKFRVRVWIPVDTTDNRFTDSIIEYFGSGITMKGYRIWNTINTGSAAYYQAAFWLTASGLENGFGHVLGTSIRYGTNYTNSAWYRYVKLDLLAYEGCTVDVFDELTKWVPYKESAGASSSDYLTDQSTYNATNNGLQETGDATDTSNMYLAYAKFTAGTNGIMNRSLIMEDGQGKWQSFTTTSGTGASKTKNTSGFRLGSKIFYMSSTTDIAPDAILGNSLIRAFVSLVDFRYSINITTTAGGANNLVPYKPLFIVGTIGNDGLFYLDDVWWAQDEPTTENGKVYIKVTPTVYNDYSNDRCYRGDLLYNGDAYWYKDGLFQRYYGDFVTNAHLPEYTIERLAQAETGYASSYILKKDNIQVGATINIPKDMVVESGEVKTVTTANVPYQGAQVGDKYIDLTIANSSSQHIYIPVKDLVDVYVAGNGIQISNNNYISVKVDSNNANGLGVGGDGIALLHAVPSVSGVGGNSGAMSAADKEKLDGVASGAQVNVLETVKVSGTALQVTDKAVNIETQTAYDPSTNKIATMSDVTGATPNVGHLKTDNTTAQTPSASESFTGDINLHKVAKTGTYSDLIGTPTIPDISNKADKVTGATNGNLAGLDSNGNLTDSGYDPSDFLPSSTPIPNDANLVHKTGRETITGAKEFTSGVELKDTPLGFTTNDNDVHAIYMEPSQYVDNGADGVGVLSFDDPDGDGDVILRSVYGPILGNDAANKYYVDSLVDISIEESEKYQKVKFLSWTTSYGLNAYCLVAFARTQSGIVLTPFTTPSGLGQKSPITDFWFPIGSNIYFLNSATASPTMAGSTWTLYTSYVDVDARYSAIYGENVVLGATEPISDLYYTSEVFLRVNVEGDCWQPYYKSGVVTEIIVSTNQLVSGGFYIRLGGLSSQFGGAARHYIFQLEDNNPLYYYDGTNLVDWASYQTIVMQYELSNYYTKSETYSQDEVDALINGVSNFEYVVIEPPATLPTASSSTMGKMYIYNGHRWITVENNGTYSWVDLGSYDIDLSNYVTEDELENRPVFQLVTEQQMQNMLDNETWETGVLYYTIEEE